MKHIKYELDADSIFTELELVYSVSIADIPMIIKHFEIKKNLWYN